ncbi:hypothetical protein LO762_04925 [Actinocorallia sp. API 0066]|uniref:hypothetical protein n=1 Tax=Actinocorallia sp. API 0066 TaxID=2896846 RepID=UPI001E63BCD1|nr:hypothetical protein [Actinocorallia sp. API 0066]MCD0448540.1 hypothetical protein [Actinocorallia sp. API 0066]
MRHGRGVVEAELRHVEARRESFVPFKPSMERELLLAGVDVPVEGLVESGRGLLVVGLVAKQFAQEVQGGVLVSVWSHGCKCR